MYEKVNIMRSNSFTTNDYNKTTSIAECTRLEVLQQYLNGELPQWTVERIRAHLDRCELCTTALATISIPVDQELEPSGVPMVDYTVTPEERRKAKEMLRIGITQDKRPMPAFGQIWSTRTDYSYPL